MNKANECTCPSGDGSLRWPCPKHPAVEQAGANVGHGHVFPRADGVKMRCGGPGLCSECTADASRARSALAQPSPVRSSLLINGYQLRAALDFIAPDGTAEQLESEACIEWRQQDADFLEAGLYAWGAEYPEEGCVLLDEEPTTAQPSPLQAEQPTADDYEEVLADHRRLVREMDVLLNGEACAAKQAMLCDLVSQVEAEVRKSGQPLLVSAERYRWLRNDDNWGADDSEGQGTSKWANLGELSGTDFDAYLDQLRGSNPVMDIDPEHSKAIAKRGRDAIVAQAEGAPVIGCLCGMPMTEGRHSPGGCTSLEEFAPHLSAQAQAKQAERPEMSPERAAYFMRRFKSEEKLLGPNEQAAVDYVLSLLAQHDRIVGELRADRDSWAEQAEQRLADWDEMRKERDAALARVAELETALEPFAAVADAYDDSEDDDHEPYTDMGCDDRLRLTLGQHRAGRIALEGRTPQAQAQQLHDLDKQCRDDVARALGLRPNQERGFAWSYLLASIKSCVKASEDSAQAQHSVPDGAADLCRFLAKLYCELDGLRYSTAKLPAEQIADALIFKWPVLQGTRNQLNIKRISEQPYDESKLHSAIAAMLAAAPGKEVGHE
ncbi:hypothetical protein [Pseudomonas aeruginosa]|uniref:hypothetical protein n=1 Tax=Pseudomonas aeruginosa TaxID=287 RepID=UPI001596CE97|nr:hypothetical protein [Pseudomonas aeruginosa]